MVAALTTCVGREPRIFGKPHQPMLDCILDRYHLVPERTCMVGDRLDTDILFGKLGGLGTLLVLTGVTQSAACVLKTPEMTPEYYAESLPAAFAKGM